MDRRPQRNLVYVIDAVLNDYVLVAVPLLNGASRTIDPVPERPVGMVSNRQVVGGVDVFEHVDPLPTNLGAKQHQFDINFTRPWNWGIINLCHFQ
ncbi:hypothetical protein D3C81_2128960 [compost metagenome]